MAVVRVILIVLGVLVGLLVLSGVCVAILAFGIWDRPARPSPVAFPAQVPAGREGPAGKGLVVYHPGMTSLTRKVAMAVGKRLAARGYDVTVDTANTGLASDLSPYDVVCFGSPTYGGRPRPPLVRFIGKASGLQDVVVGTFATAGGDADPANVKMRGLVEGRGGKVRASAGVLTSEAKSGSVGDTVEGFVSRLVDQ